MIIVDQRILVKFHIKLGKTATEAYLLLKEVCRHKWLSHARVFQWFQAFPRWPNEQIEIR